MNALTIQYIDLNAKWILLLMRKLVFILILIFQSGLAQWNDPHADNPNQAILHSSFAGSPKTLDPAKAYSSNEMSIIAQIVEPPLQYHYLKRPYTLVPLTLTQMPTITSVYQNNHIAYTIYNIKIKPGIYYQPHPAFIASNNNLSLKNIYNLDDFKQSGTKELTANDYVYEIKRLASPEVNSPILGVMSEHIVGFAQYAKTLQTAYKNNKNFYFDLRQYPLEGVKVINKYEYQIKVINNYPQFSYWLAMPFFAPIPWEVDYFYSRPGLREKNITLDWYPVGTGPYYLFENNPNQKMVLAKNPNFHGETYPISGESTDQKNNYLKNAGQAIPFIEKVILTLDKENIPRWNKFLQGYYDQSGISADSFDQAIKLNSNGQPVLSDSMKQKGIRLQTTVNPSVFYIGFNMQDGTVGGLDEKNKKLRQAISIALDYEEYISLFMNGRGIAAQSPIPPGIFGYTSGKAGINKTVYVWENNHAQRKPLDVAKKLLSEAGYPNGIDPKTNKSLVLNYDVTSTGNPDDKSRFNWMRKQFAKLGIELNIRHTEYNRFQEKVRTGQVQLFSWGWLADYPDPENFLFLMITQSGKVKQGGENAANYSNSVVDKLFLELKTIPNSPARLQKINQLLAIIQEDSPWIWGVHPVDFTLTHTWLDPIKPSGVANNILKYQKINPSMRAELREKWNQPILWPLWILLGFLILIFLPLVFTYIKRENRPAVKKLK